MQNKADDSSSVQKLYSNGNDVSRGNDNGTPKPSRATRWLILFLVALPTVGKYYCYNNPAALKRQIHEHFYEINDYEFWFNLLYSVYSFSNIVLPFFGGYFCDRLGSLSCTIIFSSLNFFGQLIFAFGSLTKSFPTMLVGRIIFGFGAESLYIGQSIILDEWFVGKQLAFVYAVNLSIGRLSGVMNNILSPRIAFITGVSGALFMGVLVCGLGVTASLIIRHMDKAATKSIEERKKHNKRYKSIGDTNENQQSYHEPSQQNKVQLSHIKNFGRLFWLLSICGALGCGAIFPFNNVASTLLLERDYFKENPIGCQLENPYACQSSTNVPVGDCPSSEWYALPIPYNYTAPNGEVFEPLTIADINCQSHVFRSGCLSDYCQRENHAITEATTIMSIPYLMATISFPIFGYVIDIIGYKALLTLLSVTLLALVHVFIGFTSVSPIGLLIVLGAADTILAAALWPAIPFSVDKENTGLAFGVALAFLNATLTATPVLVAAIYGLSENQYIPNVETCFVVLSLIATICGILLNYFDFKSGSVLNKVLDAPPQKLSYSSIDVELANKSKR